MIYRVLKLRPRVCVVHQHQNRSNARRRKEDLDILLAIARHNGNSVSRADT